MSHEACHRLLVFSSSVKDHDKPRFRFVIVLGCFTLVVEDENKPPRSLLFFAFFFQVLKTTMSRKACCHLLVFLCSSAEDDDELGSRLIVLFGWFVSIV
jgi:hypothetical protein